MVSDKQSWSVPHPHTIVATFIFLVAIGLVTFRPLASSTKISPAVFERVAHLPSVTVVNVNGTYAGEIPGTDTFINSGQLASRDPRLPTNLNTPLVVYDNDGSLGDGIATTLKSEGYTNVHYLVGGMKSWTTSGRKLLDLSSIPNQVLPAEGIELPVSWGTYIKQLVDIGAIDLEAFRKVVPMTPEQEKIMTTGSEERIMINSTNSQFVVDVLWALGIAQKSIVYTEGPLGQEEKDNVGNFASTGGWSLSKGLATNYLNKYDLIPLTEEQQMRVGDIAHNVYRPCCNNSTWFPDCNHGMAALAIIELLVSQNESDETIYRKLLGFNSFWFADSYLTLAAYFARQGTSWDQVDAKEMLGFHYSSGTGAANMYKLVGPLPFTSNFGGGCGA